MKVFLTGATGLIGRTLLRLLQQEGHTVSAITRNSASALYLRTRGVDTLVGDITIPRKCQEFLRGCQAVIHLAGSPPDITEESLAMRLDVEGTRQVLESIAMERVLRFVYASCVDVMGDQGGEIVSETDEPRPNTPHGRAKLRAERLLLESHAVWRLPVIILRLGHVCGPGGLYARVVQQLHAGGGVLPRRAQSVLHGCLSLEDAARACLAALTRGRIGEVYFASHDEARTLPELLIGAAESLRLPPPRVASGLFSRTRLDQGLTHVLSHSARPSNEKFRRELVFRFTRPPVAPPPVPASARV